MDVRRGSGWQWNETETEKQSERGLLFALLFNIDTQKTAHKVGKKIMKEKEKMKK